MDEEAGKKINKKIKNYNSAFAKDNKIRFYDWLR